MGVFEKWRTARTRNAQHAQAAESGGREESSASVAPAAASGDAWRALTPVQRVLAAGPRTVAEHGFSTSLATHWNPSFQSDLGHGAVPDAPGGVMLDAVRAVPLPVPGEPASAGHSGTAELPGLRLPVAGSEGSARPTDASRAASSAGSAGSAAVAGPGRQTAPSVQRAPAMPRAGLPAAPPRPVRGEAPAAPVRGGGAAREAGDRGAASGASHSAPPVVQRAGLADRGTDARVVPASAPEAGAAGPAQPSSGRTTLPGPVRPAPVRRPPLVSARPAQPPRRLAPAGATRAEGQAGPDTAAIQRSATPAPTPKSVGGGTV
ncbi:hypothetical protein ACFV6U_38195, partial [Streptomyces sp. NPDC059810]